MRTDKSMDWFLHDNDLRHERVKCNLNIFKNVVIILQEIVAAFTPFITTVKRIRKVFCDWGLGGRGGGRGGLTGESRLLCFKLSKFLILLALFFAIFFALF